MVVARSRLAVVVLAAGAGSRFSDEPGGKLLAPLDGRPVLEHVLEAVRAFAPRRTIVVLGHGAQAIEGSIHWAGEERVRNPDPARGIASSIAVGLSALRASDQNGVFVVLGDQPRLRADVMEALAAEAVATSRPIVVPRYSGEPGPRNPVLLMRPAWKLARGLVGDRGLGQLIVESPGAVTEVAVPGVMPDVDTPADLAALGVGRA